MHKLSFDIGLPFLNQDPAQPLGGILSDPEEIGAIAGSILSDAVVFAGLILIFLLVFAGISIMMGAGESNPQKIGQGKQAATAALLGFIIIFTAYWIVQIVMGVLGMDTSPVLSPPPPVP